MVVNERQDDGDLHIGCPTSNSLTTIPSARRRVWRPTRSTWADSHGSPWRFWTALESWDTRVWPVTTWPIATWPPTGKSAPDDIVRAHYALTVSRVNRRNSALAYALRPASNFATGGWAWVYNPAPTIRQGVKANTDAKVLKAKLAINWTGLYKILAVGPVSAAETPDGSPLVSNLLHLDLPSDLPDSDARRRVATERCKPCANSHDSGDMPKQLPVGLTQYALNNFFKTSPPYHVTQDDVSTPLQRLEVEQITGCPLVRGEVTSSRYYTRRPGRDSPNLRGNGKWTSASPAPTSCAIGPEPRTSTANPTAFTAEWGSGRHSASSPETTGSFSSAGLRLCFPRRLAPSLPRHGTS